MDGFALCADGPRAAGDVLKVGGEQAAGDDARDAINAIDAAMEIMTGARMPQGFSTVIPVENVEVLARSEAGRAERIQLKTDIADDQHVRRQGQDIARGALAVPAGRWLGPAEQMLLGGIGVAAVAVRRRPRVAIISTGRELVDDPRQSLRSGQIYNTNGPYLAARLQLAGADVVSRVTVVDESDDFRAAVEAATALGVDAIVSTGAVSMGRYDFVPDALRDLGAELLFHKVRMRPGKPLLFARFADGTLCFGLPGNPVSSAVGERFFVEAALRVMLGMANEKPWALPLLHDASKKHGFSMLQKAFLEFDAEGRVGVRLLAGQESFRTEPLLRSRVWAVLPESLDWLVAGALIDVYALGHCDSLLLQGEDA
jgi:molybdopterin molybdotransferase